MSNGSTPKLLALSRPLAVSPNLHDLIGLADPFDPLLWVRDDQGFVGVGETLRVNFQGADRFDTAAAWWRDLSAQANVDDDLQRPGSGLITFGTVAFDDQSAALSTFIVPRYIVARDAEQSWVTEISLLGAPDTAVRAHERAKQIASCTSTTDLASTLGVASEQLSSTARQWHGTSFDVHAADPDYFAGVAEATRRTAGESIEKIVIARRVSAQIDARDDLRVPLTRLAERYDDCWTFAVDGLVGASPETLMRITEGTVSARILAGTRGRDTDSAADARARVQLLSSEKEQHEHAYAVQSVITALGPHVTELECDKKPFALKLPNVWHLATDLRAVPRETSGALALAGVVHPTAAVAGTPTADAIAAIAELEPFDRERYAGPVGWIDGRGDGQWMIALRCAQVSQRAPGSSPAERTVTAYAGGGILADSDVRHEFAETVSKLRPITEAFAP